MIKCEKAECEHYNKRKKYGCMRQANPHTCKGYLMTIIEVQQREIERLKGLLNETS